MAPIAAILFATFGLILIIVVAFYILVPLVKGVGWIVKHIFAFIGGMIGSFLRVIGGIITSIVFLPLILLNVIIGRWSAAAHFGRGLQDEFRAIGTNVYRFCIGHPARFLMLSPLVEGLERRVPQAVAHAPTSDKPRKRAGQFEGYEITGSLKGGGSGGRLYIAKPDEKKMAQFARRGFDARTVVIKTFSLADGSSLPQIVRESRSLDAAKKLGLVLEHELTDTRFYYVMKYVPGDTLSVVTQRLHDKAGPSGLRTVELRDALAYACDITASLDQYHRGGLWHKDVKPDNIIVHEGRAHLVDFGLVTPLRSSMTLTTHGTEYFRDPEMVRLALRGVKVHEVNGAKFDIFGSGAVLYSVLENSFPAHGVLSQINKKCPDALKWIVRRAMADYDNRYDSTGQMLADLEYVRDAHDPFAVRVADLPSMKGAPDDSFIHDAAVASAEEEAQAFQASYAPRAQRPVGEFRAGSPVPPAAPRRDAKAERPNIAVTNWWRGTFRVVEDSLSDVDSAVRETNSMLERAARKAEEFVGGHKRAKVGGGVPVGNSAAAQLARARGRAKAAQQRAHRRMNGHGRTRVYGAQINTGVGVAVLIFLGGCVFLAGVIVVSALRDENTPRVSVDTSVGNPDVQVQIASGDEGAITIDAETARIFSKALSDMKIEWKGDLSKMTGQINTIAERFRAAAHEAARESVEHRDIGAADAPIALPPGAKVVSRGGNRVVVHSEGRETVVDRDAKTVNPALVFAGPWVVLDDAPVNGAERDRANTIIDSLIEAGVPLLTSRTVETQDDLEFIASARATAGATTADDGPSSQRLLRWLAERPGGPVGVLRIARGDGDGQILSVVVSNANPLAEAMREAIQAAANGELTSFPIPPTAPHAPEAPSPRGRVR
jgi:serine/threonine protein kinase